MFSATTASSDSPSRCLTSARSELPCAATSTVRPRRRSGTIASYQYGSIRVDDVLEALGARHGLEQVGVARVADLAELVVVGQRRRRRVVGAAPEHELLVAELVAHRGLVLALQRAVVPLVEPPRPAHRHPVPVGGVERDVRGADRAAQQRGVHDVGQQAGSTSSSPPRRASASPAAVRSTSTQPVNRFFWFQSLSPWRSRISVGTSLILPGRHRSAGRSPRTPAGWPATRRASPARPTRAGSTSRSRARAGC